MKKCLTYHMTTFIIITASLFHMILSAFLFSDFFDEFFGSKKGSMEIIITDQQTLVFNGCCGVCIFVYSIFYCINFFEEIIHKIFENIDFWVTFL